MNFTKPQLAILIASTLLSIAVITFWSFGLDLFKVNKYHSQQQDDVPIAFYSSAKPSLSDGKLHLLSLTELENALTNADIVLGQHDLLNLAYVFTSSQLSSGQKSQIELLLSDSLPEKYRVHLPTPLFKNLITCLSGANQLKHGNYALAEVELYECHDILQEDKFLFPHLYGHSVHILGLLHHELGQFDKALTYYNLALEFRNTTTIDNQLDRAATLNNIGNIFWKKGLYAKALQFHERSYQLKKAILPESHQDVSASLNNIGIILSEIGEYNSSLQYHSVALQNRLIEVGDHPTTAHSLHNLAEAYLGIQDFKKAVKYANDSYEMKNSFLGPKHPSTLNTQILIANIYSYFGLFSISDSLLYLPTYFCNTSESLICPEVRRTEALNSVRKGDIRKALQQEELLIAELSRSTKYISPHLSSLYLEIAKYFEDHSKLSEAIQYAKKGLFLETQIPYKDLKSTLNIIDNLAHRDRIVQLFQIISRSSASLGKQHSDLTLLENAMEADALTIKTLEESLTSEWIDTDKKRAEFIAIEITSQATRNALAMHQLTGKSNALYLALEYMDYGYNWALQNQLVDINALKRAGAPDPVIKSVRQSITHSFIENEPVSKKVENGLLSISKAKRELSNRLSTIKDEFPLYSEYRTNKRHFALSYIHNYLRTNNTSLLEYFTLDDSLHAFAVTQDTIQHFNLGPEEVIKRNISNLISAMDPKKPLEFIAPSKLLYESVFRPLQKSINSTNVLIVPNSTVQKISFDVLISADSGNGKSSRSLTYLIDQYSISYSFSSAHYLNSFGPDSNRSNKILALAPVFDNNQELSKDVQSFINNFEQPLSITTPQIAPLLSSLQEVHQIDERFSKESKIQYETTVLTRDQVTEAYIKSEDLSSYSIIHLASHSFTNPFNPFDSGILLEKSGQKGEDGILKSTEIFGLHLNADLVILSACDTALASSVQSVNLSGLAQGFFFAGAKSLIASLWPSDDLGTRLLMGLFYSQLSYGDSISSAMRNSRLTLSNDEGPISHPYYWAGFIHIGASSGQEQTELRARDFTLSTN